MLRIHINGNQQSFSRKDHTQNKPKKIKTQIEAIIRNKDPQIIEPSKHR